MEGMLRTIRSFLLACGIFQASPGLAADALKFGPPPAWVVPQPIPAAAASASDRPVTILLHDQQSNLRPGTIASYSEIAFKIQKPEGLAAGNLSVQWNPATDTVTVNKVEIHRGGQVIDVLKSGQTFTTIRRESNLEAAMLDGVLTANIQPEGLQEGDVVVLATTSEHSDPVLKNHVEVVFAPWGMAQIGLAHARLQWPTAIPLKVQASGALPAPRQVSLGDTKTYELTMTGVEPVVAPKDAPLRFQIGRMGEATDFRSWSEAAQLMMPLYTTAAVIPATGSLRDEVEKIRKTSADPHTRAELALRLVQDRIRYVALVMGQGGLVPASAQVTWERRFGDCKAKTALLLALLHELGIAAEPVLANIGIGDAIADRLPMIGLFNHVFVRAHLAGKDYWLDGTRTGDISLDTVETPNFGWVLPLSESGQLVHLVPSPLTEPNADMTAVVDATAGVRAPVSIKVDQTLRGDIAIAFNLGLSNLTTAQQTEFFRQYWKQSIDFVTAGPSSTNFDPAKKVLQLSMSGTGKLDWNTGYFHVPNSTVGFTPDFDRTSSKLTDAPIALNYPSFEHTVTTIRFPRGFFGPRPEGNAPTTHETLAGVEYVMHATHVSGPAGDELSIEKSVHTLVPEVAYKDALAAEPRLRQLADEDAAVPLPSNYHHTQADLTAWLSEKPSTADAYIDRGNALMNAQRFDEALTDFNEALKIDPKNVIALADRAFAYTWKHDYSSARKDIASAKGIDANNPVTARAEGFLAEQTGDAQSAINAYSKALVRDSTNDFTRLHRAYLYLSTYKYAAALADISSILDQNPKNAAAIATRALVYASKGDLAAARRDLATAQTIDPSATETQFATASLANLDRDSNSEIAAYSKEIESADNKTSAYESRAAAYLRLNRYDEALADTEEALKLHDHEVSLRLIRANIFMHRGERHAVEAEADAMIGENPQSTFAFVAAGKSYDALGLREKALRAIDQAIAMHPDVMGYLNRADIRPISNMDGRMADIDKALALEPDNVDALLQKAYNLLVKGDFKQAMLLYDRAASIDLDPENRSIPYGRAAALFLSGEKEKAQELLADVRTKSKSAQDFSSLCWAQTRWNMFLDAAVHDCEKAHQLDPKTGTETLGIALLRYGKLEEAIRELNQAIDESHSASSFMARAIAYRRQGKETLALADHAEALKLKPDEDLIYAEYGLKFDEDGSARPH
jgi:tetratricopeptide (TPR) repeat protein/transglutaminase-like putative cysteine protease